MQDSLFAYKFIETNQTVKMWTHYIISHLFLITLSFKTGFAAQICGPDEIGIGEIQVFPWDNQIKAYTDGDGMKSAILSEDCTVLSVLNDLNKCKGSQWSAGYTLSCDNWNRVIASVTAPNGHYYDNCYQYQGFDWNTACNVEDASKLSYADVTMCCKKSDPTIQQSY